MYQRWINFASMFMSMLIFITVASACSKMDPVACQAKKWLQEPRGMRVLCSTQMIQALVEEIGGEHVDTLALVYGELDPHSYQLVKGDDEKISRATLIFCNGLGLEHGPSLQTALKQHPRTVYLADELQSIDPKNIIYHDANPDPHIWLDVGLFSKLCPLITEHLSNADPQHSHDYVERGKRVEKQLQDLDKDLKKRFLLVDEIRRYLVTSHEAFYYFTRAYLASLGERDLPLWRQRFCAPEGLAPESQISLKRIWEVIRYIKDHDAHAIFLEVNVNSDAVYKIREVLQAERYELNIPSVPLYSDSMPHVTQDRTTVYDCYIHMVKSNADIILSTWEHKP